jgi:peptidyl-tRNA hydrolase
VKPVMYIFLNKDLGMSTGKSAAQVGHAVARAVRWHPDSPDSLGSQSERGTKYGELRKAWLSCKHETKLVMLAEDEQHLFTIERYLNERGFHTELVIDEGRTEIRPHSATAMTVEIVDKDDPEVLAAFGDFKVYPDNRPKSPSPDIGRVEGRRASWRWHPNGKKSGR